MGTSRDIAGSIVQVAYATDDIEATSAVWAEKFGAGPFFVRKHVPVQDVTYRGEPGEFDHSTSCGQWGTIMLEFVEDHTKGPSVINELHRPGETGLHHVACFVDDLNASTAYYEDAGYPLAATGNAYGLTRFHYIDTLAERGHFTELYEPSGRLRKFYEMVAAAARGWDGRDPVRML